MPIPTNTRCPCWTPGHFLPPPLAGLIGSGATAPICPPPSGDGHPVQALEPAAGAASMPAPRTPPRASSALSSPSNASSATDTFDSEPPCSPCPPRPRGPQHCPPAASSALGGTPGTPGSSSPFDLLSMEPGRCPRCPQSTVRPGPAQPRSLTPVSDVLPATSSVLAGWWLPGPSTGSLGFCRLCCVMSKPAEPPWGQVSQPFSWPSLHGLRGP